MLTVFCIVLDIYLYFFDKRAILRIFTIDRKFNIKHMTYLVKTYQLVVLPINIFLYLKLFWWSKLCIYVGTSVTVLVCFVYIFFRGKLVRFIVLRILKPKKIKFPGHKLSEKTYLQSYSEYF